MAPELRAASLFALAEAIGTSEGPQEFRDGDFYVRVTPSAGGRESPYRVDLNGEVFEDVKSREWVESYVAASLFPRFGLSLEQERQRQGAMHGAPPGFVRADTLDGFVQWLDSLDPKDPWTAARVTTAMP